MRVGWPQILFISTALHVMVGLSLLLSIRHPIASPEVTPMPVTEMAMSLQLRSEAFIGQSVVSTRAQSEQPSKELNALPVLPAAVRINDAPVTPAAAFALKDQAQLKVRSVDETVLCPAVAPKLDSRGSVVFILDVSGSMYERFGDSTRLNIARQLLSQRIQALPEGTPFALVVYAEQARLSGPLVPVNVATRTAAVSFLAQDYDFGGGTDLAGGFALIQNLKMGSVVLATDGDLNTTASALLPRARELLGVAGASPALTVIGISPRPHTDDERLLHELAQQQGGSYQEEEECALTVSINPHATVAGNP